MFALMDATKCPDGAEPLLVGLTKRHSIALSFVLSKPSTRTARAFPDPIGDEITTVESVLDHGSILRVPSPPVSPSPVSPLSSPPSPPGVTVSDFESDTETESIFESEQTENLVSDELQPAILFTTFTTGDLGGPDDPVVSLIRMCDDVKRFTEAAASVSKTNLYDVLSHYLTHLNACTTPILRDFIDRIGGRWCGNRSKLLLLLLEGALDTMDDLQAQQEGNNGDESRVVVEDLLRKLSIQVDEIKAASIVVVEL